MRIVRIYIMILFAAFGLRAGAITLEACVDSALANNPAVAAAALEVEKARILKGTAFNPPMTEVTLKQETTGGGGPENGVFFNQEFEFPSVYVARHRSLSARNELAAGRFDLMAAEVEAEVSSLYYSLLYSRELLRLNGELDSLYGEFCRVARIRFEEGESGRLEMMNAERVMEKNRLERNTELVNYETLLAELRRVCALKETELTIDGRPFAPLALPWSADTVAFGQTLLGIAAGREVAVAERELTVAKNELLPGLRLGATVQALIKGFNPYHVERLPFEKGNFMGMEVGVSVPLFFGAGKARLRAAQTERRISLLNMETEEVKMQTRVGQLSGRLKSLGERLEYFSDVALPRASEIRRIAEVSYSLSEIDYIEFIANIETAFEIYRDYAGCVNDYNQAVIESKKIRK